MCVQIDSANAATLSIKDMTVTALTTAPRSDESARRSRNDETQPEFLPIRVLTLAESFGLRAGTPKTYYNSNGITSRMAKEK